MANLETVQAGLAVLHRDSLRGVGDLLAGTTNVHAAYLTRMDFYGPAEVIIAFAGNERENLPH